MSDTPTPITDELAKEFAGKRVSSKEAGAVWNLCRDLERELAEAKQKRSDVNKHTTTNNQQPTTNKTMNNIFERIEIAESLGYISYGNCSDTPEQKAIAKWWNAENPSSLVELPTLNELTIEKLERELADMTEQRDALAEALDTLLAVVGLTPIAGNKQALQEAFDQGNKALAATKGGNDE